MTLAPFSLRSAALRASEIAKRVGVEASTVYRWMRSGELPSIDVAGTKYVLVPAFEGFLERYEKGATLEEQAERSIGQGFEEAHENAFDPLEGLALPIALASVPVPTAAEVTAMAPALDQVLEQLRHQLAQFEAHYKIASEHIHRLHVVEHQYVESVPEHIVAEWARTYAAYLSLSLVAVP